MLSLARSRYTLPSQLVFLAGNGLGLFVGMIYNGKTPDLYPNNAHHKIGWIITIVVGVHVFLSLLGCATGFMMETSNNKGDYQGLRYVPSSPGGGQEVGDAQPHRSSYDSGHGTEGVTESLRSNSVSTLAESSPLRLEDGDEGFGEAGRFIDVEFTRDSGTTRWQGWLSKIPMGIFRRGSRIFRIWYGVIDRVILPFGFIAFTTGIVTFGRFFVSVNMPTIAYLLGMIRKVLTSDIGGARDFQRVSPLDQGWRVLLDRRPHLGQVVWFIRRPWMGMAPQDPPCFSGDAL